MVSITEMVCGSKNAMTHLTSPMLRMGPLPLPRLRGRRGLREKSFDMRHLRRWALNGAAAVALGYILMPLVFVVWLAFFRQEIPSFPPDGYSLKWFAAILDQRKFVDGFRNSLQVGVLATAIGLALGVPAALCLARRPFRLRTPVASLLLMPLIVPGVVLGTSMYVFHVELENGLDVDVLGTFYALVAGHIVIVIPWVVRLVTASLAGLDRATEEAAQNLGANPWVTFWRITVPAIRPGIVAGALFGFVTSFGNLEMSLFLVGPGAPPCRSSSCSTSNGRSIRPSPRYRWSRSC